MKRIFITVGILFFLLQANAQVAGTHEFILETFNSIKYKDEKRYMQLFPDAAQMKIILKKMMASQEGNDSVKAIISDAILETVTDSVLQSGYKKDFKSILDSAAAAGISWQDATYIYHTADTISAAEIQGDILSGLIIFNSKGKEFFIAYEGVLWLPGMNGWMGITVKQIGEMKYPD